MQRKYKSNRLKFTFLFILFFLLLTINGYCRTVLESEAIATSNLWFAMELNSGYLKIDESERIEKLNRLSNHIVFYLISKDELTDIFPHEKGILAYVIKYEPIGYVIVSGDDRIEPIIVFDTKSEFRWDQPELNFLRYFLGKEVIERWENFNSNVHPNWEYLRSNLNEGQPLENVRFELPERSVYILLETALWSQSQYYNDVVVANNGNTSGIPVGCTATALGIKLQFHKWPLIGENSHSYNDIWGDICYNHFVNFSSQTYDWENMPVTSLTSTNLDVANLLYHCGVAVDMDYEIGASGAWPTANSFNTYFRYKGTEYIFSNHETPIITSIKGGLPVEICSSTHALIVCGYRDTQSPYFYLNCGWNGSNNGWYNFDQIPGGDPTIDRSCPYGSPENYIYIDNNWSGIEDGNIQTPFNSISEGESAIPTGGQLWIKEGSYNGVGNVPITFDRAMTIKSYEGTVIIGNP